MLSVIIFYDPIKDPLFIYVNMNETNAIIRDELISWLNYKPIKGNDELLNILILEMFEDYNYQAIDQSLDSETGNKSAKQTPNSKHSFSQQSSTVSVSSHHIQHQHSNLSMHSIRSGASGSTMRSRITLASMQDNAKPTLIDTYYDLLKSLHLHVSIKPMKLNLSKDETNCVITLPKIDVKSIGTKCDLEEELKSSRLVELPFTNLRYCEKTSDKLPWIFDLTGFQVRESNASMSRYSNDNVTY